MRALDNLVRAGTVLYVGISDTPAWIVAQANTLAGLKGWSSFIGLQVEYSLIQRAPEREYLPMARALDIGVTGWGPLGGGVLTGKYNKSASKAPDAKRKLRARIQERNLQTAEEVQSIANELDRSAAQVAINLVRHQSGVVIPILGARKVSQIQDNLGAIEFELTADHLKRLDEVSKIELGFPHDFLANPSMDQLIYAGMRTKIDNHRSF